MTSLHPDRSRNQFPHLKSRLLPNTEGDAGILIAQNYHCYRTPTREYPQPIVILEKSHVGSFFSGRFTEKQYQELQPNNSTVSNKVWFDLADKPPELIAKAELTSQIIDLVGKQLLDESTCPDILSERIYVLLKREPNWGVSNSPKGLFWEHLRFSSFQDAINTPCEEIRLRTKQLINDWIDAQHKVGRDVLRWYEINLQKLITLEWLLSQLSQSSDKIIQSTPELDDLFSYLRGQGLEKTASIAASLALTVFSNFIRLIERNFPKLTDKFPSYRARNGRLILELSEDTSAIKSDYLHLSYIWLPSFSGQPEIKIIPFEDSLAELFIVNHKSSRNIFSSNIRIKTNVGGVETVETNGVISRISYPDIKPITNQVYQLVLNEAGDIFGNHHKWREAALSGTSSYYEDFSQFILEGRTSRHSRIIIQSS